MSRQKMAKAKANRASKARAVQAAKHDAIEAKALLTAEKPKSLVRRIVSLRGLREGLLTFGAITGVLCMLVAVAAFAFDVKPVIFRSGSMSPAIDTGALAISHTVKAKDLAIGDVVTVKTDTGVRVTHRVQNATLANNKATLVLKGDSNDAVDDKAYVVSTADRVLFDIPKAGYLVSWLSGPAGVFGGGLLVGLLLLTAFGPGTHPNRPGTKRFSGIAVAALAIGVCGTVVAAPTDTQAAYTNAATLTSGTFARLAPVVTPPAAPVIRSCAIENGNSPYTISWTWAGSAAPADTTFSIQYGTHPPANVTLNGTQPYTYSTPKQQDVTNSIGIFATTPSGTSVASNVINYSGGGNSKTCTGWIKE